MIAMHSHSTRHNRPGCGVVTHVMTPPTGPPRPRHPERSGAPSTRRRPRLDPASTRSYRGRKRPGGRGGGGPGSDFWSEPRVGSGAAGLWNGQPHGIWHGGTGGRETVALGSERRGTWIHCEAGHRRAPRKAMRWFRLRWDSMPLSGYRACSIRYVISVPSQPV